MNKIRPTAFSVTSLDVARLAGVSRSAVSRAFTPGASISQKTREKVQIAASELGYSVNLVARGLNKQRTDLVGMIASAMSNPYRSEQIDALAKRLVHEGFRPMLFCIDEGMNEEQLLSILLNYQVSGVVITSDAPPVEICKECARLNVPLALVDRLDDLPFVDRINGDNTKGGHMAAEALMAAGRRNLVAVKPHKVGYSGRARIAAFIERAREAGLEPEIVDVVASEYEGGLEASSHLVSRRDESLGIFCPSDTLALGLLDALRSRHGVAIPQEMSLIGYDDIPQAAWAFAELTTIKQSVTEFAKVTVDLLKSRIGDPEAPPKNQIVDVHMVERKTV
jgi:DNA-binding LacI/PurR family transcriptional regulator